MLRILLLLLITGCTAPVLAITCIDAKLPRVGIKEHRFDVAITNHATHQTATRHITCKHHYDAQCSVRGNSWTWEEAEPTAPFSTSIQGYALEVDFPSCPALVENKHLDTSHLVVEHQGRLVFENKTPHQRYFFKDEKSREKIELDFPVEVKVTHIQ